MFHGFFHGRSIRDLPSERVSGQLDPDVLEEKVPLSYDDDSYDDDDYSDDTKFTIT